MTTQRPLTVEFKVQFKTKKRGRKPIEAGERRTNSPAPFGQVPRVTKLMALAIRFDELIRSGEVEDYAEIARLGHITRSRASQIMSLLMLAPDIQLELLSLPHVKGPREAISERTLRPICSLADWNEQRNRWSELKTC